MNKVNANQTEPRGTIAEPGEVIYPATGPSAPPAKATSDVLAKAVQIQRCRELGYTVEAPRQGEATWSFRIGGAQHGYFADSPAAWDGAIAHMNGPRTGAHEYTFDMTVAASITVKAATVEEGKRLLWDLLQCAQVNFGAWPDGSAATGEVSLNDLGDVELGLIDGDEPMEMCECCAAMVPELIGAPCGTEVCRDCFDNGAA